MTPSLQPEDVEPFLIPPLGKHYQDIWDEEDMALPFASSSTTGPPAVNVWDVAGGRKPSRQALSPAVLSRERTYVPVAEMVEEDLLDEAKGLGGLNERAVAAMMKIDAPARKPEEGSGADAGTAPDPESKNVRPPSTPQGKVPELQVNGDLVSPPKDVKVGIPLTPSRGRDPTVKDEEERDMYSWPIRPHRIASPPRRANERDAAAATLEVDVGQLEQGVAREMRLLGLLDAEEAVSVLWARKRFEVLRFVIGRLVDAGRRRNILRAAFVPTAVEGASGGQQRKEGPFTPGHQGTLGVQ